MTPGKHTLCTESSFLFLNFPYRETEKVSVSLQLLSNLEFIFIQRQHFTVVLLHIFMCNLSPQKGNYIYKNINIWNKGLRNNFRCIEKYITKNCNFLLYMFKFENIRKCKLPVILPLRDTPTQVWEKILSCPFFKKNKTCFLSIKI